MHFRLTAPRSLGAVAPPSKPLTFAQCRLCSSHASSRPARPTPSSDGADQAVTLRFAPSPTGFLHLGGLRTVLYNHLLARKLGGSWTLRIEDTDQTRYVEGAVESLLRTLKWAGLDYDEGPDKDRGRGPYFQSQRKHVYDKHLETLIKDNKAYHCFCSPDRLQQTRNRLQKQGSHMSYDRKCLGLEKEEVDKLLAGGEKSVVRFKSSTDGLTQDDLVYDSITYNSLPLEDFVLRKSDGLPTYHFANVIDDHEMGITHVLRGEEWLPSTPKHLALYAALAFSPPQFAHLPLLVNADGSKLSKRAGDVKVEDYIARGYEPEAVLNFVALLGWSPQGAQRDESGAPATEGKASTEGTDVLPMDKLIELFSLGGVNKNRPTMSTAKLDFLNRAHLQLKLKDEGSQARKNLAERVADRIGSHFPHSDRATDVSYLGRVLFALKERIYTIADVPTLGSYFFVAPDLSSAGALQLQKTVKPDVAAASLRATLDLLPTLEDALFSEARVAELNTKLQEFAKARVGEGKGTKEVMNPLRWALTGQKVGAGVAATVGVLGREEVGKRLAEGLRFLEA